METVITCESLFYTRNETYEEWNNVKTFIWDSASKSIGVLFENGLRMKIKSNCTAADLPKEYKYICSDCTLCIDYSGGIVKDLSKRLSSLELFKKYEKNEEVRNKVLEIISKCKSRSQQIDQFKRFLKGSFPELANEKMINVFLF